MIVGKDKFKFKIDVVDYNKVLGVDFLGYCIDICLLLFSLDDKMLVFVVNGLFKIWNVKI